MRQWLGKQRNSGDSLHLTFEVSGLAGYLPDELIGEVDNLVVSNPSQMTWIYRTAKKTDRIDARKQALLLKMGQVPQVHMPNKQIRQRRQQIQHRRNLVNSCTQIKNRIRALLKSRGFDRPAHAGGYWKYANRQWMQAEAEYDGTSWGNPIDETGKPGTVALYKGKTAYHRG